MAVNRVPPLVVSVLNAGQQSLPSAPDSLMTGLIAYYKMEDDSDSHTGGFNLTDVNGVSRSPGVVLDGADFDSSMSQLLLGSSDSAFDGDGPFSCHIWLHARGDTSSLKEYCNKFDLVVGWYLITISGVLALGVAGDAGLEATSVVVPSPPATQYFSVYFWRDPANDEIGLRMSDSAQDVVAFPGPAVMANTDQVRFGGNDSLSLFCDCSVDEIGFWNRLLTPAEVTRLASGITYNGSGPWT